MDLEKEALGKLKRILKYKGNNDELAIRIMEQYFFDKQEQQLSLAAVSKSVTAKDLKCPKCKQHALMKYIDGKECTSCGYVC